MGRLTLSQTNIQLYNQLAALGYGDEDLQSVQRSYELAARLFGGRFQASGREFLCHVIGVTSILADLGEPCCLVRAGMLHNVYSNGDFGDAETGPVHDRREMIRNVVGAESEEVIFHFGEHGERLRNEARSDPAAVPAAGIDRDVVLLHVVDRAEKRLLDSGLMNFPKYRRFHERNAPRDVPIAERLGFPVLVEALLGGDEPVDVDLLAEERGEVTSSFVVVPRSYRS
jgi:(p)ppGpp synthase/HD superfamily hydrolase